MTKYMTLFFKSRSTYLQYCINDCNVLMETHDVLRNVNNFL